MWPKLQVNRIIYSQKAPSCQMHHKSRKNTPILKQTGCIVEIHKLLHKGQGGYKIQIFVITINPYNSIIFSISLTQRVTH